MFLGDFKCAYPDSEAKLVGVYEALARSSDKELKYDGGKLRLFLTLTASC